MRVSNFLLWQIAYAEIWVTDTLWPDFRSAHLLEAILDYQKRDRRYGGINAAGGRRPLMTRVLSALVLLPARRRHRLVPAAGRDARCSRLIAALLAFVEYAAIVAALGARVPAARRPAPPSLAACIAVGGGYVLGSTSILMSAVIAVGALAVGGGAARARACCATRAASILPIAYIGLPLGALAAVRAIGRPRSGPAADARRSSISDSAQYYSGRAFGRRPLAPAISPKKTLEGAIGGLVFGTLAMALGGRWVFPGRAARCCSSLVGACISALGIVGDLFESLLKRSAGVKDSSHIIPGHGGVLDRIDSWLFAAPVYYVFVALPATPA